LRVGGSAPIRLAASGFRHGMHYTSEGLRFAELDFLLGNLVLAPRYHGDCLLAKWCAVGTRHFRSGLGRIFHRLTGQARDRRAITSLRLPRTIGLRRVAAMDRQDCRSLRRAPRAEGPLTHLVSPRGEKCGLGCRRFGFMLFDLAELQQEVHFHPGCPGLSRNLI